MNKFTVYISCANENENVALIIKELLSNHNISVSISSQIKLSEERTKKFESMNALIFLFSKESINSQLIDNEITEAINNRVPILPFQVDNSIIKENLSLDFMLKKSQWVSGYPDREKQFDNLVVDVCRLIGIDAIQTNPTDSFEQYKRGVAFEYGTNGLVKNRGEALFWLEKAASNKNLQAMMELYRFYRNSEDDNEFCDYEKSDEWLRKASMAGYTEAQYIESFRAKSEKEQLDLLEMCSEKGHKKAKYELGLKLLKKPNGDKNRIFQLIKEASEINDDLIWRDLGHLYQNGIGTTVDYKKAIECFKKAGMWGEFDLAKCYYFGIGVRHNYEKVIKMLSNPIGNGDPRYYEMKAECYLNGKGVGKNIEVAIELYKESYKWYLTNGNTYYSEDKGLDVLKKAAELGDVEALYKLGNMYLEKGMCQQAFSSFLCAAEKGLPIAKFFTAHCYDEGIGVEKNKSMAFKWLKEADIPGLGYATYLLGTYYYYGEGTAIDKNKAIDCYFRAANQNEPLAEYELSQLFKDGIDVKKDVEISDFFYKSAINHGLNISDDNL